MSHKRWCGGTCLQDGGAVDGLDLETHWWRLLMEGGRDATTRELSCPGRERKGNAPVLNGGRRMSAMWDARPPMSRASNRTTGAF